MRYLLIAVLAVAGLSACAGHHGSLHQQQQFEVPPKPPGGLEATSFDGRMEYLFRCFEVLAENGPSAQSVVMKQGVEQAFLAIKAVDGAYAAAGIYVLLADGPGRPHTSRQKATWEGDVLQMALSDPVLTAAVTQRAFPPVPLYSEELLQDLTSGLILEANRGNLKYCQLLVALHELDPLWHGPNFFDRSKCWNVPGAPVVYRQEADVAAEVVTRAKAILDEQKRLAIAAQAHCAAIGAPVAYFENRDKGADFPPEFDIDRIDPLRSPHDREVYINRQSPKLARRKEYLLLSMGVVITPSETPFAYTALARQRCGM